MNPIEQAIYDTIKKALIDNDGNRTLACKYLDINPRSLYNYMHRFPELKEFVRPRIKYGNRNWKRYPDK